MDLPKQARRLLCLERVRVARLQWAVRASWMLLWLSLAAALTRSFVMAAVSFLGVVQWAL